MTKPSPPLANLIILLASGIISLLVQPSSCIHYASAFVPSSSITRSVRRPHTHKNPSTSSQPPIITSSPINSPSSSNTIINNRNNNTQLQSFFGLGPAELILIAIAGLIFIGPSKLLEFSKEAGSVAGKTASSMGDEWSDLKSIPEEFQKGVEEGEIEARSRKAKVMDDVGED